MRLLRQLELSFVSKLVKDTRQLIQGQKSVSEKVAKLNARAARHAERAEELKRLQQEANTEPGRQEKLGVIIALREKAVGYLRATARFVSDKEVHPGTIRQMPRLFAIPTWDRKDETPKEPEKQEFPFMEFSS